MTWSVTADSTVLRSPAPSTATTVTSVSPIISAAAVEAVRPGLRTEFELASSPATPPLRRAGQADEAGQRLDHVRGGQRDAHEQRQDAEAEQQGDGQRAQPAGEDADGDGGDGRRDHADGRLQRVGGEARRRAASSPRGPPRSAAPGWRAAPA